MRATAFPQAQKRRTIGAFPMPLVMFNNVLIALDGSAAGERVLRLATAVAVTGRTRLNVLCVVDPGYRQWNTAADGHESHGLLYPCATEQTSQAERVVGDAVSYLSGLGQSASGWVCDGAPADTLIAEARRIGADLIVMGHRHLSRLQRWADPSTADAVVERAPCPVLIDAMRADSNYPPRRAVVICTQRDRHAQRSPHQDGPMRTVGLQPRSMYYGTPLALIVTINEDGSENIVPMSLSWSLRDRIVIGMGSASQTVENLLRHREFTFNLASADMWRQVEALSCLTSKPQVPPHKAVEMRYERDK
ncbi:MAG: hypothetical protein CBARDCOR_2395 [uncultured Caballeronia sp.]|nr:MAG: hypothetical protein CBARDCOR_2395 [uncultured Caballeronia sp.]